MGSESSNFYRAFLHLMVAEGDYSDDERDPGGRTRWGITEATARKHSYTGKMSELPLERARTIYYQEYWLTGFEVIPYAIAYQIFDGAVNSGVAQSVRWIQRVVGVADDGILGPVTCAAINAADVARTVALFNCERLTFVTKLTTWDAFGRGWARRMATNIRLGVMNGGKG